LPAGLWGPAASRGAEGIRLGEDCPVFCGLFGCAGGLRLRASGFLWCSRAAIILHIGFFIGFVLFLVICWLFSLVIFALLGDCFFIVFSGCASRLLTSLLVPLLVGGTDRSPSSLGWLWLGPSPPITEGAHLPRQLPYEGSLLLQGALEDVDNLVLVGYRTRVPLHPLIWR